MFYILFDILVEYIRLRRIAVKLKMSLALGVLFVLTLSLAGCGKEMLHNKHGNNMGKQTLSAEKCAKAEKILKDGLALDPEIMDGIIVMSQKHEIKGKFPSEVRANGDAKEKIIKLLNGLNFSAVVQEDVNGWEYWFKFQYDENNQDKELKGLAFFKRENDKGEMEHWVRICEGYYKVENKFEEDPFSYLFQEKAISW